MDNQPQEPLPDMPCAPTGFAGQTGSAPCPEELEIDDDTEITCWCGDKGTYEQLFDDSGLEKRCGGTGELNCYCGGDFCVCHYHGTCECPGCPDCEDLDDDDDDCGEYGPQSEGY